MEKTIREVIGPSGLMEFIRFDHGEILRKESGKGTARIVRFVVGNPLIMKQMVEHVPDAGSYAPVTILIDERSAVSTPFLRHDGQHSRTVWKFYSFEHRKESG